jgi:hypothetical protein
MEEKEAQRGEMVAQNPIALSHQEDDMGNVSQYFREEYESLKIHK